MINNVLRWFRGLTTLGKVMVLALLVYSLRVLAGNYHYAVDKEKFKECLFDMKEVLDASNQEFFLASGTLLGAVREKDFISHDHDIDLGIFSNKYKTDLPETVVSSGKFRIRDKLGSVKDSFEVRFKHNNGTNIDVNLFYPFKKNEYYITSFFGICNNKPEGYCKWRYPITGLEKYSFLGKEFLIPGNYDEVLTVAYGDWRTPVKFSYHAGLAGEYRNLMN